MSCHTRTYEVFRQGEAALLIHMGCQLLAITFSGRWEPRYHFHLPVRQDHELLLARMDDLAQRTREAYEARRSGRTTIGESVVSS